MTSKTENLYELTRNGQNICKKCNKPKIMYYEPWCPRCQKPETETIQSLNLLQCLYYLEHTYDMDYDAMWKLVINNMDINNDTYVKYHPDIYDIKSEWGKLKKLINTNFHIKTPIAFWISW